MQQENVPKTKRHPKMKFGLTWLLVVPLGLWAIVTYYIPVSGGTLNRIEMLMTTPVIVLLVAVSLFCHLAAHLWVARLAGTEVPSEILILIFGDASQCWPVTASERRELIAASAGPIANLFIAGLTYLLWKAQLNDFWGNIVLLISGFNLWLFLINLTPAFPMDGGRLVGSLLRGFVAAPDSATRPLRNLGFLLAAALVLWGVFLFLQHSRFSLETALIEFLFILLLLDGLRVRPVGGKNVSTQFHQNVKFLRGLGIGVLFLFLSTSAAALLLLNNGLEAPGVALPVESMVNVPPPYRHNHAGHFYLTTVVSHAPILAGEWMVAKVDPAIVVVPPERVVPKNTTPQKQAAEGYQMLDESEAIAITVGFRLAGYPSEMIGRGARVTSILPESPAHGLLQPGDVITALNGVPIRATSDLTEQVKAQPAPGSVKLEVVRNKTQMEITIPLIPPASPNDTPKIGITVTSAGFDFKLPFPVSIVTQMISGGPSAGLVFTLTIYNTLSPRDVTGGGKIAGTGTISLDGTVGPIGGVKQKVAAAEGVGASYFLCPVENYEDARSVARHIKVIKIATAQQAIEFLQSLPAH